MTALIAAEWLKLRSLRSTWWTLGLTALTVIVGAAMSAREEYANFPRLSPQQQLEHGFALSDAFPLMAYLILLVIAASSGAATMVSEYGSGLIRVTLVAVPARSRVLLAKVIVVAAAWTVTGVCGAAGGFAVSQWILSGRDANAALSDPGTLTALAGATLVAPVAALIGLGIAVLLRHGGASYVAAIVLLVLVPQLFTAKQHPGAEIRHTMVLSAWQRLTEAYGPPQFLGDTYPPAAEAWLAYLCWPLAFLSAAFLVFRRRDA
ncbi:ABC transporter permease [Actinoplanes sp. L3-i22]|uniref:ABC transporter permease n=1 Tax=Actinoplanes sp. L3-i22 TaxID=2836373 RepID=UPI001C7813B2|nr:ABC transporter permease [Actinoplanes sp. L3-i22]BCY11559.1 ABC transporter permease [Actinoplanes sp. L3-i22]